MTSFGMKTCRIAALAVFFNSSVALASTLIGVVDAVHDGDTVTLKYGSGQMKVRLAGIDAPELSQPYGVESRAALRESVLGKQVQVETLRNDRYGRIVGKVLLEGVDINLKQILSGMAWVHDQYLKELSKEDKVSYLESVAQSKAIPAGLWKDSNPVEPWIWRKK